METQNKKSKQVVLVYAHVCSKCGRASRREELDGMPDTAGVFHCSECGHQGPLNESEKAAHSTLLLARMPESRDYPLLQTPFRWIQEWALER